METTAKQQAAYNEFAKALYQAKDAASAKKKLTMPTMDPEGWFKRDEWPVKAQIPVAFAFNHKTHKGHLAIELKREIVFVEDEGER